MKKEKQLEELYQWLELKKRGRMKISIPISLYIPIFYIQDMNTGDLFGREFRFDNLIKGGILPESSKKVMHDAVCRIIEIAKSGRATFGTIYLRAPTRSCECSSDREVVYVLEWITNSWPLTRLVIKIIPTEASKEVDWDKVIVGWGCFNGLWRPKNLHKKLRKCKEMILTESDFLAKEFALLSPSGRVSSGMLRNEDNELASMLSVDNLVLVESAHWSSWSVVTPFGEKSINKAKSIDHFFYSRLTAKRIMYILTVGRLPDIPQVQSYVGKEGISLPEFRGQASQMIDRELKKKNIRFTEKGHVRWSTVKF